MIEIDDESEFSTVIADLILTLNATEKYTVKFWLNNTELSFGYTEKDTLKFFQEGIKTDRRTDKTHTTGYIIYDTINYILVIDESDKNEYERLAN